MSSLRRARGAFAFLACLAVLAHAPRVAHAGSAFSEPATAEPADAASAVVPPLHASSDLPRVAVERRPLDRRSVATRRASVDAANVKASRRSAARAANEGVRPVSSDVSLDLNDNHATPSRGVSLPSSPSDPIASSNAGPDADTPGEREATRRAVVRGRRARVGAAVHRGRARGRRRRAEARR